MENKAEVSRADNEDVLLAMLGIDAGEIGDWPDWPSDWDPYDDGLTPSGEKYIQACKDGGFYNSGRFRGIYLDGTGEKVILETRNGGGNREAYFYIFDILSSHPEYLIDYDDEGDCTYAYIEFSVPEKYKSLARLMARKELAQLRDNGEFMKLLKKRNLK